MAKNWWFKFDFRVWRTDSDLRRCSLEARAFWLELLCVMYEKDLYEITGTYDELAWLAGCAPEVSARCVLELKHKNVADVTLGNGDVTLLSRRLKRDVTDREQTRLRVQKHRRNACVTVQSKSKSKKEEEKSPDEAAAFDSVWDEFLALLKQQGHTERGARSKIGLLKKNHGEAKLNACYLEVRHALQNKTDAFAYFSKVLDAYTYQTEFEKRLKAAKREHYEIYGHLDYDVPFNPERHGIDPEEYARHQTAH